MRDDGAAILFDWELFRPGVPVSDLAPVVPGLAAPEAFDAAASAYLAAAATAGMTTPWNSAELARDATVAKVVNVIATLAAQAAGAARVPETITREIVDVFPAWLGDAAEGRGVG